jgi:hypothetical protein
VDVCSLPELAVLEVVAQYISSQVRRNDGERTNVQTFQNLSPLPRRIAKSQSRPAKLRNSKNFNPPLLCHDHTQPRQQTHSCWSNLTSQGDHRDHRICERPLPTITVSTAHSIQVQQIIASVVSIKARIKRCLQHPPAATDLGLYNNCERLDLAIGRMLPANTSLKIHNSL